MKIVKALVALMLALSATGFAKDKNHVILEIDGIEIGQVALHQGPSIETAIVDYQDGDDIILKSRPGCSRFGEIIVSRKMKGEKKLLDWYLKTLTGEVEKKGGALIICDKSGDIIDRYDFEGAWPTKWEGGLKEKVTLAVDSIAISLPAIEEQEAPVAICEEVEEEIIVEETTVIEEPEAIIEEPTVVEEPEVIVEEPACEPEVIMEEPAVIEEDMIDSEPEAIIDEEIFEEEASIEEE